MTQKTRRKEGVVVSNKMQKTVVVAVETFKRHRIYKKILRQMRRFKVHDENNACALGDLVRIVETRPLSKDKRWRVAQVLVRGEVPEVAPKEIGAEIIEEVTLKAPPPPAPAVEEAVEEPEARTEEAAAVEGLAAAEEVETAEAEAPAVEAETAVEVEEPVAEAEAVEEVEAPVAEAVAEPEVVAEEAEAVEESVTLTEEPEAEEESPQGTAEADQPSEPSEEAPEAKEEK
jgi:small subunit ribosomal protein S17